MTLKGLLVALAASLVIGGCTEEGPRDAGSAPPTSRASTTVAPTGESPPSTADAPPSASCEAPAPSSDRRRVVVVILPCEADFPPSPVKVERAVDEALAEGRSAAEQAMTSLLGGGLTAAESDAGLMVPWQEDVLLAVSQEADGTLRVNLSPAVQRYVVSAQGYAAVFFQPIYGTAFAYPEVDRVVLELEGSEAAFAEWWQIVDASMERTYWEAGGGQQ